MQSIGERIKHLRRELLTETQTGFGARIGLKANSVSDIEKGKNAATEQTIKAICREFNVNEEWLRFGTEPVFMQTKFKEDKLATYLGQISHGNDDFIKDIVEVYMELDNSSKEALKEIARKMAKKIIERG